MNSESKRLYSFMHAAQGDWRNAVYITCSSCPYSGQGCGGHLLSVDADGTPILFSCSQFEELTGETIVKDECAGAISHQAFDSLYYLWLIWNMKTKDHCSIVQILQDTKTSGVHIRQDVL